MFSGLGLNGNTSSLLATGILSIVNVLFTIPAILFLDKIGRRKLLMAGALGMCVSHSIIAGVSAKYGGNFDQHVAAGWVGVIFIYVSCSTPVFGGVTY